MAHSEQGSLSPWCKVGSGAVVQVWQLQMVLMTAMQMTTIATPCDGCQTVTALLLKRV